MGRIRGANPYNSRNWVTDFPSDSDTLLDDVEQKIITRVVDPEVPHLLCHRIQPYNDRAGGSFHYTIER